MIRTTDTRCVGAEPIVDAVQGDLDHDPVVRLQLLCPLRERGGHADIRQRGPEIGDECPHLVQAAAQHVAQECDLGLGGPVSVAEHAVEVLDLEDGIRQHLGRSIVDVLGHALAFALLGLDDPEAHGCR